MENSKNKVIFIVIILIVVLVAGYFFLVMNSQSAQTGNQPAANNVQQTPPANQNFTPMTKADILSLVNSGKLLTGEQKQNIIQSLIGDKIKTYNFTDAEKAEIIQAINRTK